MHPILYAIPTPGMPWGDTLPIYSYGVMLGTSMIIAWQVVMWIGERDGFDRDTLANAFIASAVTAIVGSRILYVVTNPDEFHSLRDLIDIRRGGLVAYGGFLGGVAGSLAYLRHRRDQLLREGKKSPEKVRAAQSVTWLGFADVTAPTLALGLAFTRIGCYLYGCDFGARLGEDAPGWLRTIGTFPHWADDAGSPAWSHHVASYDLAFDAPASFPVHPTQLYESTAGFTLLGITLVVWSRRRFRGQVLLSLAMAYGVWRFLIEYVRDDPERGQAFGFSTSQLISLAIVPVAAFFFMQARKARAELPVMRLGAPETYLGPAPVASEASPSEPAPSPSASAKRSGAGPKRKKKKR